MRVGEVAGWLGRLVWWVVEWCGGVVVALWSGGSALVGDSVGVLVGILVGVLRVRCLVCGSRCFSCCFDRMIWSVTCLDFLAHASTGLAPRLTAQKACLSLSCESR